MDFGRALGTRSSQAARLLGFLKENDGETLYLVGAIINIRALRCGIFWLREHTDGRLELLAPQSSQVTLGAPPAGATLSNPPIS